MRPRSSKVIERGLRISGSFATSFTSKPLGTFICSSACCGDDATLVSAVARHISDNTRLRLLPLWSIAALLMLNDGKHSRFRADQQESNLRQHENNSIKSLGIGAEGIGGSKGIACGR